jgi:PIN domain nuclease of toxin-antitoxin system
MKFLLDTHTVIWWISEPNRLSSQILAHLYDKRNLLLISVVSLWEMQIKVQLGKLDICVPLPELIQQQQSNQVEIIPILYTHVLALDNLPPIHKDPFDRLLIAQANVEDAILMTRDPMISRYPVECFW